MMPLSNSAPVDASSRTSASGPDFSSSAWIPKISSFGAGPAQIKARVPSVNKRMLCWLPEGAPGWVGGGGGGK